MSGSKTRPLVGPGVTITDQDIIVSLYKPWCTFGTAKMEAKQFKHRMNIRVREMDYSTQKFLKWSAERCGAQLRDLEEGIIFYWICIFHHSFQK